MLSWVVWGAAAGVLVRLLETVAGAVSGLLEAAVAVIVGL